MSGLVVFFDADALLAGSASRTGAAHLLLTLSELTIIEGVTSVQAAEEARRNLAKKVPDALAEFEEILDRAVAIQPNATKLDEFASFAHPKDVPILAAAVTSGATWLVTFNTKHYYNPPSITVLRPREAVEAIRITLARDAASMT